MTGEPLNADKVAELTGMVRKVMDEALHENKLSVVFEDISAARETLDRRR